MSRPPARVEACIRLLNEEDEETGSAPYYLYRALDKDPESPVAREVAAIGGPPEPSRWQRAYQALHALGLSDLLPPPKRPRGNPSWRRHPEYLDLAAEDYRRMRSELPSAKDRLLAAAERLLRCLGPRPDCRPRDDEELQELIHDLDKHIHGRESGNDRRKRLASLLPK